MGKNTSLRQATGMALEKAAECIEIGLKERALFYINEQLEKYPTDGGNDE